MKLTQRLSLKLRLTLLFLALSLTAWFAASLVAWQQTRDTLDKLFDTQQMLFAKRLLTMDLDEIRAPERMRKVPKKAKHGRLDDDALAFAIYTPDGRMVLNDGENGRDIPYHYRRDGFDNGQLNDDNDEWRFLWLTAPDGKYRVVVGQEHEYRQEMALDVVRSQFTPWLVALPIMLLVLIVLLSRELRPLKKLSQTLRARTPDATDRLATQGVPIEVRPVVDALNQLFARTQAMMARERRFTSDAAHELRSPLTALKVQTEVAQLSLDDPQAQAKALTQLHAGIDRASRLVEQLLTLSRLDSLESLDDVEPLNMADLLQSVVMDSYHPAQQAGIEIRLNILDPQVTRTGQQLLLSLLVRNLLDNAVRYSPRGSRVEVTLDTHSVIVRDNGPGIAPDALTRIGERFYRPPGQDQTGSGLGLSIVKRIAALHRMTVTLGNGQDGGFEARISW
ncbi:quorum sensing histidine kinase QseC [Leclercia adecarboxylata]|jgi:two-component system sensor histidine kinase QseC|uniref:Sensor protein QseC n=5 Tax=Leclercia adecarboxylata TaxID=83655 RepID=A0A855EKE3_9ENTR|nr:quorum sensing histidine kinase QseC [Leclercia adecarboxylata]MCE9984837.1 two-component system sensor histidine kinase QseC [Leclercia adecarboxylata]MCU6673333.1 two-component system sensor histidine kinase QseC [Leclercia adecarboxylata]MDU1653815.1 quorum sensing histidine kinase QseC [Leclercia adecarboxylata]MDU6818718.1 quorum sensing histidine kinase QseC [Leclercia adecarboxylata]PHH05920.1 two-component system sensor histidine kinase QseC [Leclercia adecarboxylata]